MKSSFFKKKIVLYLPKTLFLCDVRRTPPFLSRSNAHPRYHESSTPVAWNSSRRQVLRKSFANDYMTEIHCPATASLLQAIHRLIEFHYFATFVSTAIRKFREKLKSKSA